MKENKGWIQELRRCYFVPGMDERFDTGSIITMTSDERVQIYVPSPQTTPYNTITKGNNTGSTHHTILPWGAGLQFQQNTPAGMREDATPPPYSHRTVIAEHRSVTPIYLSNSSNNTTVETNTSSSADYTSVKMVKTNSTSLEQVKVGLVQPAGSSRLTGTSAGEDGEDPTYLINSSTEQHRRVQHLRQKEASAGEKTLAGDLPSLPQDDDLQEGGQQDGPVSLSDIQLTEEEN